jgi:hypothetical protein
MLARAADSDEFDSHDSGILSSRQLVKITQSGEMQNAKLKMQNENSRGKGLILGGGGGMVFGQSH